MRDEIVTQHTLEPFLTESEVTSTKAFMGSMSWANKMKRELTHEMRADVMAVTDPAENSFDAQTESLLDSPSNIDIENSPGSPSSYHDPFFEHPSMQKHKRKRDVIDLQSKEQAPKGRD